MLSEIGANIEKFNSGLGRVMVLNSALDPKRVKTKLIGVTELIVYGFDSGVVRNMGPLFTH